jgi:hypothetical protein
VSNPFFTGCLEEVVLETQGVRSTRKGWNRPRHSVTDIPVRRQDGRRTVLGFVVRVYEEVRHGTGVALTLPYTQAKVSLAARPWATSPRYSPTFREELFSETKGVVESKLPKTRVPSPRPTNP